MSCLGFKGGIGTSSRVTPGGHTVAVLLMTNFGERERLTVDGVPVGRLLGGWHRAARSPPARASASSSPTRPSTRSAASGWPAGSASAWPAPARWPTTAAARSSWPRAPPRAPTATAPSSTPGRGSAAARLDDLFAAVVDAAEESVLNSLLMSPTTVGRDGNTSEGSTPSRRAPAGRGAPCRALSGRSASRWRTASSWRRRCSSPTPTTPQPCLLEALPYRKDDLTSSYAESYRRLRDEFGYAVCRVDLRGTGSSGGDATDEYPPVERTDLATVIAWLAEQEWCDGNVGMFGTSYSGFNSLQIAAERPPALKAICAIYASDDRWTDDVHWRGHALRLVDLVDYCHYMTPMCVLPPVPAEWPGDWRDGVAAPAGDQRAVAADLAAGEPGRALLAGRLAAARRRRLRPDRGADADRGRLGRRLPQQHLPHRRRARRGGDAAAAAGRAVGARRPGRRRSPGRGSTSTSRWSPGSTAGCAGVGDEHVDRADVFVRTSTVPEPDLDLHEGYWVSGPWPPPTRRAGALRARRPAALVVEPDVGTAAWIDCAGHLPWGLSGDQREDDARSLTWDSGRRRGRDRGPAAGPAAVSAVGAGGVAVGEALRRLPRRHLGAGHPRHARPRLPRRLRRPSPLVPGEAYEVDLLLDACAYRGRPGQTPAVSVAGADWPNTIAPPAPVTLTVHGGSLELPLWPDGTGEPPTFTPGSPHSSEDPDGVIWSVTRDVLRRTTTCTVRSGSTYDIPTTAPRREDYVGEVAVDRRTFAQWATAETTFRLAWPGIDVRVVSDLRVDIGADGYDVVIDADAYDGGELISHREWREPIPR